MRKNFKRNNLREIKETSKFTSYFVKALGVAVALLGFATLAGSAGSCDLGTLSFRETVVMAMAGLSMMVGGCFILSLGYSLADKEHDGDELILDVSSTIIGAMAYNNKYNSWMTVVDYRDDENWAFALCSRDGRLTSNPVKSRKPITNYRWYI